MEKIYLQAVILRPSGCHQKVFVGGRGFPLSLRSFLSEIRIFFRFQQTQFQWQVVFYISAAILSFGGVFYLIFASGEVEDWAKPYMQMEEETEKNGGPGETPIEESDWM